MLWICTKCSLHFKHRSIFDKHLSSIEHAEAGQAKEEPNCKISWPVSQLKTLTIPPNTTQDLHLGQIGQVTDESSMMPPSTSLQPTSTTITNPRDCVVKRPFDIDELMRKKVNQVPNTTPETSPESSYKILPITHRMESAQGNSLEGIDDKIVRI